MLCHYIFTWTASGHLEGSGWTTFVSGPHHRSKQQNIIHFMPTGSSTWAHFPQQDL